jgi:integrase
MVKRFFPSDRATPSKKVRRLRYKSGGIRRHGSAAQPDEPFRREGTAAGQPAIRFHDLRHTAASILLARGVHVKLVSEMLGHSTITLTLDTYSHVIPAMHADAAAAMDAVITA